MQNLKANFELELDNLLGQYFEDEDLNQIDLNNTTQNDDTKTVTGKINDFYRSQLDIDIDSFRERVKIDRTITFSEKQLIPDEFSEFLLELGRLCISNGKLNLANEIFKKTIKSSGNTFYKAESTLELANIFSRRADCHECLRAVAKAEKLYKELKDSSGIAKCHNLQGAVHGEYGDIINAKTHFQKSLSLIDSQSNLEMAAALHTNLGIIDHIQENKDDAKMHLKNALQMYKKLENNKRVAEVDYNIGMAYFESKDYAEALKAFDEGIEIAKDCMLLSILCLIYLAKSQVLIAKDDISSAVVFADKAFEISHNVDDKLTLADIYKVKGVIERRRNNFKLAESYLLNSLRINNSLKNDMNIAETSLELAALYNDVDGSVSKKTYLNNALNFYKQINASQKINEIEAQLRIAAT